MGVVLLVGIMGLPFYISCNVQEYNGKAQARREAGDVWKPPRPIQHINPTSTKKNDFWEKKYDMPSLVL